MSPLIPFARTRTRTDGRRRWRQARARCHCATRTQQERKRRRQWTRGGGCCWGARRTRPARDLSSRRSPCEAFLVALGCTAHGVERCPPPRGGVPPLAVSTTRAEAFLRAAARRGCTYLWLHKLRMQLELRRQPWHGGARGRSAGGASARHQRAYIAPPWTGRGCRIKLGPPAGGVLSSCTRARRAACWQSFGGKISGRI